MPIVLLGRYCVPAILIISFLSVFLRLLLIQTTPTTNLSPIHQKNVEIEIDGDALLKQHNKSNQTVTVLRKSTPMLLPQKHTILHVYGDKAVLCVNGWPIVGLGNQLNVYWTARAIAYFMNWTFVLEYELCNISMNNGFRMFKMGNKRMMWTWFLNESFDNEFKLPLPLNATRFKYNRIWRRHMADRQRCFVYPHHCSLMQISFNQWFIPLIQNNTRDAFKRYYEYNRNNSIYEFYSKWMHVIDSAYTSVIVIHIRLGDILNTPDRQHRDLLNMKYYATALDMIMSQLTTDHITIKIVSQLSTANAHNNLDRKAVPASQEMMSVISQQIEYFMDSKRSYELEVIGNDTLDNDFYKLVTAPYIIGSISTLCVQASMAHFYSSKLFIMPDSRYWGDAAHRKTVGNATFGLLMHHKWIAVANMSQSIPWFFNNETDFDFLRFKEWFINS
eukprot:118323_1